MPNDIIYPRFLQERIEEALADSPVVLIHGPRQCGKTILARLVGNAAGFAFLSFDDDVQRAKAGKSGHRLGKELAERVAAGGFPSALARASVNRRAAWYRAYGDTLIERDIRDLARISALDALPRLLQLAAPFQISRQTIREYLTLLSRIFLVDELPAWHTNRLKWLVKTAKLHIGDTGLACALLYLNGEALWADRPLFGRLLETFVYQELCRQASWQETPTTFSHPRQGSS